MEINPQKQGWGLDMLLCGKCILPFSLLVVHFVIQTYVYEVQQGQKSGGLGTGIP